MNPQFNVYNPYILRLLHLHHYNTIVSSVFPLSLYNPYLVLV